MRSARRRNVFFTQTWACVGRDHDRRCTPRDTKLDEILVDWDEFRATRAQLGAAFVRILGYFREDGTKSVAAIEDAMRARDARGLVMPAHTLKSEARQFGGEKLGAVAEDIEMFARQLRRKPDQPRRISAARRRTAAVVRRNAGRARARSQSARPAPPDRVRPRRRLLSGRGFPHRLKLPARQAAPQPFERTILEAFEPGFRPQQHRGPHAEAEQIERSAPDAAEQT